MGDFLNPTKLHAPVICQNAETMLTTIYLLGGMSKWVAFYGEHQNWVIMKDVHKPTCANQNWVMKKEVVHKQHEFGTLTFQI